MKKWYQERYFSRRDWILENINRLEVSPLQALIDQRLQRADLKPVDVFQNPVSSGKVAFLIPFLHLCFSLSSVSSCIVVS